MTVLLAIFLAAAPAGAQEVRTPTFTEDVAPIVFANCTSCHRPDEAAPFALRTYAEVRKRGRMIVRVTKSRFMPPWHPVEGHGDFTDPLRLTDEEIATLASWVEGGMPEGDPTKLPPLPEFTPGWQLGKPDLVVTMKEGFDVPAGGPDIYRNFVVSLGLEEDRWLTAIEVRPGARSVLHHIVFGLDTKGRARELDGADGKPGWSRMQGGRDGIASEGSSLLGWAVGSQARHFPLGLGVEIPKGVDLILRSHFHPSGKAEVEKTTLGLHFADEPPSRTMTGLQLPPAFGVAAGISIPPGEKAYSVSDSFVLPVAAQALTVGGHAHYICKTMQITVQPPTKPEQADRQPEPEPNKQSIFLIEDWAFDWQNRYQYSRPIELEAGTRIDATLTYDNSSDNPENPFDPPRRIRWGLESTDEMGSVTLLLVAKKEEDSAALRKAIRRHNRQALRGGRNKYAGLLISRLRMLDADGDGKLAGEEIPQRFREMAKRFDKNGDGAIDDDELEAIAEQLEKGR